MEGSLPFVYLGVPFFRGKPKRVFLQSIVDKAKARLEGWHSKLLSMAGRVQLIKSVIYPMLLHSFMVYAWPISLIKQVEGEELHLVREHCS